MNHNDQLKMKAIQKIMADLDQIHGHSLKSKFKKPVMAVEEVSVRPKDESESKSEAMSEAANPMLEAKEHGMPDMNDEDTQRLLEMYSRLK